MFFGGIAIWFIIALVSGIGLGGAPKPGQLPWCAASTYVQCVVLFGLGWYVMRWRRLPLVVRLVCVGLLAVLIVGFIGLGDDYLAGLPPLQ